MESWNLQDTQEPSTIGQRLGKEAGKVFDSLMSIYRELYSHSFSSLLSSHASWSSVNLQRWIVPFRLSNKKK